MTNAQSLYIQLKSSPRYSLNALILLKLCTIDEGQSEECNLDEESTMNISRHHKSIKLMQNHAQVSTVN